MEQISETAFVASVTCAQIRSFELLGLDCCFGLAGWRFETLCPSCDSSLMFLSHSFLEIKGSLTGSMVNYTCRESERERERGRNKKGGSFARETVCQSSQAPWSYRLRRS